jgi:hypothetical protein
MRLLKRLFVDAGVIAVLAALLALTAPKTAHGIVATVVQVVNTKTNPVNTLDSDMATRIPYRSQYDLSCSGVSGCSVSFNPPPAGYRLVIQEVSASLPPTFPGPVTPQLILSSGAPAILAVWGVITPNGGTVNQSVDFVVDPADGSPVITDNESFAINAGAIGPVTLTGYMVNCSVAVCQPVQH